MSEDNSIEENSLIGNDQEAVNDTKSEQEPPIEKAMFQVKMNKHIKNIPDYTVVTSIHSKKRRKLTIFLKIVAGFIIVGLSILLAWGIIFAAQDVLGINKQDKAYIIDIQKNASVSEIAQLLQDQGVIQSAVLFKAFYNNLESEGSFQYGTYPLNSNMPYNTIIAELQQYATSQEEVKVVFPEGLTLYDMGELLESNNVCGADEFIEAINTKNYGFDFEDNLWANDLRFHQLEGYAFPDTYNFFINENPVSVAKKMLKNYQNRVSKIMENAVSATGLSQENIMIIASIVQREASTITDMKKVASVYLNRLSAPNEFSRLQADPTRDYANQLKLQMDIINQEIIDAYNTYEGLGLPPGPICNPGLDAIQAVLALEETPYYYFCTDAKTGEFYYAETLEQHNANVYKAGLRQGTY